MPRTDPATHNRPKHPTEVRALRLKLGRPSERWSQRHLAAHIAAHPVPNARGATVGWIKKMEQGKISGDTYAALRDYLLAMLAWQTENDRIIPRPFVHEKTPRPRARKNI